MSANNTPHTADVADAIRRAYVEKSEADTHEDFVSWKNLRDIPAWSDADRRFCEMAERCPRIESYQERPDILILDDRGHAVPFVVDFLVVMDGRRYLVGLSLGFAFPEAAEARYVRLARTRCAMDGEEFVHLSGSTLMPEMYPVRDEPDALPPLALRGLSCRHMRPAQQGAVERAFQAESDRLLTRFLRAAGSAHDVPGVCGPA